jgi:hypothetical protein
MPRKLLIALALFLSTIAAAQNSTGSDHLYLHLDREAYTAGENIWFRAYIHDDSMMVNSTSLHVELIGDSGKIIQKKIFPIAEGFSFGQLEIDKNLRQNIYFLRAYTPEMLESGEKQFYRMVPVLAHGVTAGFVKVQPGTDIQFSFQPLSGVVVAGALNIFSYVAYNEFFQPIEITQGELWDSKKNMVSGFTSQYPGAGSFAFTPQPGENYVLKISYANGLTREYPMPAAQPDGYTIQVSNSKGGKKITVEKSAGAETAGLKLAGYINGGQVFEQAVTFNGNFASFAVPAGSLASGVLELQLQQERSGQVICKTRLFNGDYVAKGVIDIVPLKIDIAGKARSSFRIKYRDTVGATMSISVTDAAAEIPQFAPPSIGAAMLTSRFFNQELPAQLNGETAYHDLLLNSSIYRQPATIAKKGADTLPPRQYIYFTGYATREANGDVLRNSPLECLVRQKDSSVTSFSFKTDKDGFFKANSLYYTDTAQIIFFMNAKKGRETIKVQIADDKKFLNQLTPAYKVPIPLQVTRGWQFTTDNMAKGVVRIPAAGRFAYDMKDVATVIGKKSADPSKAVMKRYVRGVFGGVPRKRLDLITNPPTAVFATLHQYIRANLFQVQERLNGGSLELEMRRARQFITRENPPVTVYLDEFLVDYGQLANIYMNDVALVLFFDQTATTVLSNTGGGVLAVYTKKPQDYFVDNGNTLYVKKMYGYSPVADVDMPDYNKFIKLRDKPDNRSTLYWNPVLNINPVVEPAPIEFFNSDKAKRFKVVVQGIMADGRYIYEEKYLE